MQSFTTWMERQESGLSNEELLASVKQAITKHHGEWSLKDFYDKKPTEYKVSNLSAGRMFELLDPGSKEEVRRWAKKVYGIGNLARL